MIPKHAFEARLKNIGLVLMRLKFIFKQSCCLFADYKCLCIKVCSTDFDLRQDLSVGSLHIHRSNLAESIHE